MGQDRAWESRKGRTWQEKEGFKEVVSRRKPNSCSSMDLEPFPLGAFPSVHVY